MVYRQIKGRKITNARDNSSRKGGQTRQKGGLKPAQPEAAAQSAKRGTNVGLAWDQWGTSVRLVWD